LKSKKKRKQFYLLTKTISIMKQAVTFRNVLLAIFSILLGGIMQAQPQGDYIAVIGSSDFKKVVLFNYEDGSLAVDNFIDFSALDPGTLKQIVRVGDELWATDQTKDRIYRFMLDGTYISTITGALDNLRGLRQFGNEVWLANAGTQNGAPGNAVIKLGLDGTILGNYPVEGSPWSFWPYTNNNVLISFSTAGSFVSQIAIFDQNVGFVGSFNTPGEINFIQQVSEMQNGDFLAASFSNVSGGISSGIHHYNPQGVYQNIIGGTGGTGPRGCWELGNGNVMWTNGSGIHIADVVNGTSQVVYTGQFHLTERMQFGSGAVGLPFAEDFEIIPPDGWEIYNMDGGGEEWLPSTDQNHTTGGSVSAFHDFGLSGYMEDGWIVTPALDFPEFNDITLSFWSYNNWPAYYYKNSVLISTGSGDPASGDFVEVWAAESVASEWIQSIVDLSSYSGNIVYVAFRYQGDDADAWYLDDILIEAAVPVLNPPLNLSATVDLNDVTLNWDAPQAKELLGYNIYRDEVILNAAPVTATTYFDEDLVAGNHFYGVSAIYTNGESPKAGPVQVMIIGNVGKIHGFIRNAVTHITVDQATITATNADNGTLTFMTPFGAYYSLRLPAGTYDLTCTAEGYEQAVAEDLVVIENMNKGYTFYLEPIPVEPLTGIVDPACSGFRIYPNPADEIITIEGKELQRIQITDQTGMIICEKQLNSLSTQVDISKLTSGLYFVMVYTLQDVSVKKLIIK